MKIVEVVAAIIQDGDSVLATQRGYGDFSGLWEFPGGKIEPNESKEEALKREIIEELGVEINIENFVCTTDFDYPKFHLTMHCFICSISKGNIELKEHTSSKWMNRDTIYDVEWLPADKEVIEKLKNISK